MIDERDNMSSDIEFLEDIMSLNESVSSTSSESELKELEKRVDGTCVCFVNMTMQLCL